MKKIIDNYKLYLENELGFTEETVLKYIKNLEIMFSRMNIIDIKNIKKKVLKSIGKNHKAFLSGKSESHQIYCAE